MLNWNIKEQNLKKLQKDAIWRLTLMSLETWTPWSTQGRRQQLQTGNLPHPDAADADADADADAGADADTDEQWRFWWWFFIQIFVDTGFLVRWCPFPFSNWFW